MRGIVRTSSRPVEPDNTARRVAPSLAVRPSSEVHRAEREPGRSRALFPMSFRFFLCCRPRPPVIGDRYGNCHRALYVALCAGVPKAKDLS
jgi:hypothetical protein